MPGRQSHGRSVTAGPANKKKPKKSYTKSKKHALNAFAIAAKQVPESTKGLRLRDLDVEPENKRRRRDDDDEDGEDEDDGDQGRSRTKRRKQDDNESDGEIESDSDGNEWHVGVDEDEDSDIDSDEAFDEEDEERFEGFTFRGSSSKDAQPASDDEADGESLGEDAIDLAQALDQFSEDDEDEESRDDSGSGSDDEDDSSESPDTDADDEDEDDDDISKFDALRDIASGYAGQDEDMDEDSAPQQKAKVGLEDLGLFGVKDPNIRKSLKLMKKEEKATKPGSTKKLDVPLARRQQDRLLRIAASEKANSTLDRWQDTVKHNRRAEHLMFPLPETLPNAGLDNGELQPITHKTASNELEQTIMSIMEESGLGPSSKPKPEAKEDEDEEQAQISRAEMREVMNQRRRERELQSREQARAKRIKKIKSKAYRRVHRKEAAKNELAMQEQMELEGNGLDSEEEREAQHRRRAMERMGSRHKESKWAKMAKNSGRAAWDDEFRAGLTDMARRDEELRRRVEGRSGGGGDESSGTSSESESDDEDSRQKLLQELQRTDAAQEDGPHSNIMKLAFMQRAENAQKKLNDEAVARLVKELGSDAGDSDGEDPEEAEVGRRTFGMGNSKTPGAKAADDQNEETSAAPAATRRTSGLAQPPAPASAGAWSQPVQSKKDRKKAKNQSGGRSELLDMNTVDLMTAVKPASKPAANDRDSDTSDDDSEIGAAAHPFAIRDADLVARAFGGDDVEAEFEREKAQVEEEDDDKVIDNTLPGWGSWAGDGVSKRAVKKDQKRFQTVVKGVKKADRKDAKLEKVIINEKRIRKGEKYMASQLGHEFENRHQYERSLRLPLGPEWSTKETFQSAIKPRVIVKQGIIAPMAKPRI
ncbi:uncharacterized protein E0L32_001389 [Thyridium curvatum]|uniref:Uncharacterized protein n=1 Tax=Thyridium curvatum TaxID=1093900 RepID=A0A507AKN1_9PEZI|nr:uncharacterized protein E0L32_001389 [Thyridium curvatum]TPX10192.1 hypothetical protein E0L32_001389 [Thyridium curvatum]